MPGSDDNSEERFWAVAAALLDRPGVTRSTMMGLPCLRLHGAFFASFDRRSGDLLVKLPAQRVDSLVDTEGARAFAPAGRRFREWASIPPGDLWPALVDEAFEHVSAQPPSATRRRDA